MRTETHEQLPILFGRDNRTNIVAIEPAGHFVRLFHRQSGTVTFQDVPFNPFILVDSPALVSGCKSPCSIRRLEGDDQFRYQLLYESWGECCAAHDYLKHHVAANAENEAPRFLWISDLSHQFMLATGCTLFKGMEFSELRCLALDIETWCAEGYQFSNPKRPEDRIISIALKDSHGDELVLGGDSLSEAELLQALNDAIRRCDPDVITGHNIFRFDLEYIAKRAALHGIRLHWGRNGSEAHISHSRWSLADTTVDYPRFDLYGRHVIDTYFLVQLYDVGTRTLQSHGLKQVARHFGLAPAGRTYLAGADIARTFRDNPQSLYDYNLDDVRETMALFRLLAYPWFLQSRMFPYSFQNCPLRGNATRINSLLLREYLQQGHSIPAQGAPAVPFEGGYTEQSRQGVFSPVAHCDVASLYPSLMLTYRLGSRKDSLGIFLPMLAELRRFRLEAKQAARSAGTDEEQHYWESLQQVFKVVINSFFGYLGTSIHNFSDPDNAAEITRLGRVTIKQMLEMLRREGAEALEVDTDGIYFKPPADCVTFEQEQALVRTISETLPEGIEVEHDGRYRAMFAYKAKNYALLQYDESITIKGSGLKSRGIEPYLREFMSEMIRLLLTSRADQVERLYGTYCERLRSRTFEIEWLARTETLNDSPANYREKVRAGKRNPSAAFEIALKEELPYRAGDQVRYYVCGSGKDVTVYEQCRPAHQYDPAHPDVNLPYYLDKLRHLKQRFEAFLPQEPTLF